MPNNEETLEHFIERLNLTLASREKIAGDPKDNPPDFLPWSFERCVVRRGDRNLALEHTYGFPDEDVSPLEEILDDAAADAVCVEDNPTFEKWVLSFHGMSADDPSCTLTESDWNESKSRAAALKDFFGEAEYKTLLYNVARL